MKPPCCMTPRARAGRGSSLKRSNDSNKRRQHQLNIQQENECSGARYYNNNTWYILLYVLGDFNGKLSQGPQCYPVLTWGTILAYNIDIIVRTKFEVQGSMPSPRYTTRRAERVVTVQLVGDFTKNSMDARLRRGPTCGIA